MTKAVHQLQDWALAFERTQATRAREPAWLKSLRTAAFQRFQTLGFPTPKTEAWKYTHLEPLIKTRYRHTPPSAPPRVTPDQVASFRYPGLDAHELVFVNGIYAPELSTSAAPPPGVRLENLETAAANPAHAIEHDLAQYATFEDHAFVALNTALWHHGAFLDVAPKTVLRKPLHVLFLSTATRDPVAIHPRLLARFGAQSQAGLLQTFAGLGDGIAFTNAVTELHVGRAAHVQHLIAQRELETGHHIHAVRLEQEPDSTYTNHNVALGGALARTDLDARFAGPGAEATLNGLYLLHGTQHVDNHTGVDHVHPHCTSREYYKGILDDKARGVFYGKVNVRKDAQKTNASQVNKNLLLSDGALVDSTPALEINANDVKCSHGSTIGQLDPNSVFYLQTRGIDAPTARSLLTYAFARDLVAQIPWAPVRARLDELLLARLKHGPAVKETLHALEPQT